MLMMIYAVLLPVCSFILCVFGFFVGRCARKLPILDENLPWTVHRSLISADDAQTKQDGDISATCRLRRILPSFPYYTTSGHVSKARRKDRPHVHTVAKVGFLEPQQRGQP